MNPILSLTVLTYNRKANLISLLEFLNEEIMNSPAEIRSQVELIISDNASTDGTSDFVKSFKKRNELNYTIKYNRNIKNEGIVGNFKASVSIAKGEYLWWIGDDDAYKKGMLQIVYAACKKNPSKIFLNHSGFVEKPWDNLGFSSALFDIDANDEDAPIKLLEYHIGVSMFISANIFKRAYINEIFSSNVKINLALPLYCTLYCLSKGKCEIVPDIYIGNHTQDYSWHSQWRQVFLFDMPYYVSLMPELGFCKQQYKRVWNANYSDLQYRRIRTKIGQILRYLHLMK